MKTGACLAIFTAYLIHLSQQLEPFSWQAYVDAWAHWQQVHG